MTNIKLPLEINEFVDLMLATMAEASRITDPKFPTDKKISLPTNYKQRIENILCSGNNWKNRFSQLINIDEYFSDHFEWESKLAKTLKNKLIKAGKIAEYSFETDSLLITISKKEIDKIYERFPDNNLRSAMKHFTSLLQDFIYTREFQERFYDYSADAVAKMSAKESEPELKKEETTCKRKRLHFFHSQ